MSEHKLLPDDPYDQALARLIGLPNGAHTQATVRQAIDFYGKTTQYVIQTVRHDDGETTFITQLNAQGSARYILPPAVLETIDRQRASVATMVKRRHGRRLAEERRAAGVDLGAALRDPAVRARALAARKAKAATKRARRARR